MKYISLNFSDGVSPLRLIATNPSSAQLSINTGKAMDWCTIKITHSKKDKTSREIFSLGLTNNYLL
jgi:hypothetical protein